MSGYGSRGQKVHLFVNYLEVHFALFSSSPKRKKINKRLALSKQLASLARTSLSIQTAALRTILVTVTPGRPGAAWRGAPPPPPELHNFCCPIPSAQAAQQHARPSYRAESFQLRSLSSDQQRGRCGGVSSKSIGR